MAKIANWMGHAGSEPGAVGIVVEDDVTRQARAWSVAYMRACGHTVITDNDDMSLVQRISASNAADAIIEWHGNYLGTGTAYGTEAWYSQFDKGPGIRAAQAITAAAAKYGFANRGAKNSSANRYGRLGILDDPNPVAVLVELFFIDNAGDVARWRANGKAFVEAMSAAFLASLGFKSTPDGAVATPKPVAPSKPVANSNIPAGFTPQDATFVNGDTPIMNRIGSPSTAAKEGGYLPAYGTWKYDSYAKIGSYTWIHHVYNGVHVYLPVRQWYWNGTSTPWGTFK
ncbi:N-acetylmuramoyl-L-alanine amidase [Lapidilactobacillus wuchangensis]|uniref:N-acetylmuramoyl-L-alanine amidase n=1 Tax=Lapidilactobacillus wuchangensis TaxID=2486001 RepID=UPI000F776D2F|nr:N-acetylmuramoyl-L-alanine amidase [Lapidilactobacillus wuchangensis]